MPGRFLQTAAAAVVLAISLPVLSFAIFTSTVALVLLSVRATVLSSEFWMTVLIESWNHKQEIIITPQRPIPVLHKPGPEFRPPMPRSRTNSFIDAKRLSHRSDSHVSLAGTSINRDFEGVGGWRNREDDDPSLWTNMKSRLERSSSRHHRRSVTGEFISSTALNSPEFFPVAMRTPRTRPSTSGSGSASPQSYFNLPIPSSRSMLSMPQRKRLSGTAFETWDFASRPQSFELEREAEHIGMAL